MTRRLTALAFALGALAALPAADKKPDEPSAAAREAARVAGDVEVEALAGGKWVPVKRIDKPLLYYGDATRENDRGSVWGWGESGRPVALLELFQNVNDRERWVFTVCNTSGGKVRARHRGREWWRENESACEPKPVPGAPAPAADPAQRQRQLKALARKFAGHQFWDPDNTRYELRRLESPLRTYRDEAAGVLDGALFTLANGTNPEIMLFVEARSGPKGGPAAWHFAVGRLSHAELHLAYDGKEVFSSPRGDRLSGPDKPYWLGLLDAAPPGAGK